MIWTKGELTILGGSFSNNSAPEGGVVYVSSYSTLTGMYDRHVCQQGNGCCMSLVESNSFVVVVVRVLHRSLPPPLVLFQNTSKTRRGHKANFISNAIV